MGIETLFHSHSEVRKAIALLIDDPEFRVSRRNKRFLEFVVEAALEGHGERIKAYTIAVDVFGRSANFDPSLDPIVRIEAARLRNALRAYYDGPGLDRKLQIVLPVGRYVPEFVCAGGLDGGASLATDPRENGESIKVLVEASALEDKHSELFTTAIDLTIESLKLRDIRVFYAPSTRKISIPKTFDCLLENLDAAFVVDLSSRNASLMWRVTKLSSNEVLSSTKVELHRNVELLAKEVRATTQQVARIILNASGPDWT